MPDFTRFRKEQLISLLQSNNFLSVRELSEELNVSPLTIRRDLNLLQDEGLLERVHGGARLRGDPLFRRDKKELAYFTRLESLVDEKKAIAKAALDVLEPDQTILLDSSSSSLYFALAIPDTCPLTILTHSAYLPVALADRPNIQVISTGGLLHPRSMCYFELDAEKTLAQFHANTAFFGAKGVSSDAGCTDAHLLEIQYKSRMLNRVEQLVILADHTKIGNVGLASFAPIDQVDVLITDGQADAEEIEAISQKGAKVITAKATV